VDKILIFALLKQWLLQQRETEASFVYIIAVMQISSPPNSTLITSAVFARLTVRDRDRPFHDSTLSVCMWCDLIIIACTMFFSDNARTAAIRKQKVNIKCKRFMISW